QIFCVLAQDRSCICLIRAVPSRALCGQPRKGLLMSLTAIVGATVIDGTGDAPMGDAIVLIEDDRVRAVASAADTVVPEHSDVIHAEGLFVIPGMMDANVHLCGAITPDLLIRHEGRYTD